MATSLPTLPPTLEMNHAWADPFPEGALQGQRSGGAGAGGGDGAKVLVPQRVKAGGGLVSIVSSPHAGRLEGASDKPEFEAIKHKTSHVATYCKSSTCRSVTWKN
jgi:hypothetical protein